MDDINFNMKFKEKEILDTLIFGGLQELNKESEALRRLQINQGMRIHTCNNYNKSIEVIKIASKGIEKKLKLLTKVYYRYPSVKHNRFRPLIDQLDEIVDRLGFIPSDWSLQLCCYCNLKELGKKNAKKFFKKIIQKYKITKIYLEYYPIYKYQLEHIDKLNNFYKRRISFGLIGYQNCLNRVFTSRDLKFLSSKSISVIFLGFLGKGIHNRSKVEDQTSLEINQGTDSINANLIYLLTNQHKYKNLEALTQVSSLNHYEDLKERIIEIDKSLKVNALPEVFVDESKIDIYNFHNYDQYGGYITLRQYCRRPKFLISKIKYLIISFIVGIKFGNNFWC